MNFVTFEQPRSRRLANQAGTPSIVTIGGGRYALLNPAAFAALEQPTHVTLHWEPDLHLIGMRPALPNQQHAYTISMHGQSARVFIGGFAQRYGIDLEVQRNYAVTMVEDMLVIPTGAAHTLMLHQ